MSSLLKNVASQNFTFCLVNATTGAALVGATVTVNVTKDNGTQAAGGGTVTGCGNGQYNYAPTQAETNATDVGFLFTATNAIPVNIDFHTDPGVMLTAGVGTNQISLASGLVTVGTNNDKSGYSLTQTFPANFSSLAITAGGAVTVGTNNDKSGYSLSQAFPSNFASMLISGGGAVTVGTNNDKAGYSLTQAFPTNFATQSIDGSGNVSITSNVKQNTAKSGFMFVMTDATTHAPKTGLTVVATRSLDGAAFAACANSVTEVANGTYVINLAAADVNALHVMLRFTATNADDLNIEIVTQP